MPERWTRVVLRYRALVLLLWLVALVAGGWTAQHLQPLLADSFAVPGTDSARASAILAGNFGERADGAFVVVFDAARTSDPAERQDARRRLRLAAGVVPSGHQGTLRAGGGILWGTIETALAVRKLEYECA